MNPSEFKSALLLIVAAVYLLSCSARPASKSKVSGGPPGEVTGRMPPRIPSAVAAPSVCIRCPDLVPYSHGEHSGGEVELKLGVQNVGYAINSDPTLPQQSFKVKLTYTNGSIRCLKTIDSIGTGETVLIARFTYAEGTELPREVTDMLSVDVENSIVEWGTPGWPGQSPGDAGEHNNWRSLRIPAGAPFYPEPPFQDTCN